MVVLVDTGALGDSVVPIEMLSGVFDSSPNEDGFIPEPDDSVE